MIRMKKLPLPEAEQQIIKKKREKIKKKRQQITIALRKFNNARKKEMKFAQSIMDRIPRAKTLKEFLHYGDLLGKIVEKYKKFWVKNLEFIERYLRLPVVYIESEPEYELEPIHDDIEREPEEEIGSLIKGKCLEKVEQENGEEVQKVEQKKRKEVQDVQAEKAEEIEGYCKAVEDESFQWYNLEDVKTLKDLKEVWKFRIEWERYLGHFKVIIKRKLGWGERSGTRQKFTEQYYYMRQRGIELRDEGKSREQVYEILSMEVEKLFGYCPGQIRILKEGNLTYQDACRFWHLVYNTEYDKKKYNYLRPRYKELKSQASQ